MIFVFQLSIYTYNSEYNIVIITELLLIKVLLAFIAPPDDNKYKSSVKVGSYNKL